MMTRRKFLVAATVAAAGVPSHLSISCNGLPGGLAAARTPMGVNIYSFGFSQRGKSTLEFLDYCAALGAGRAQEGFSSFGTDDIKQGREPAEKPGGYGENLTPLPQSNPPA